MQDFTFCPAEEKEWRLTLNAEWLVSWKVEFL